LQRSACVFFDGWSQIRFQPGSVWGHSIPEALIDDSVDQIEEYPGGSLVKDIDFDAAFRRPAQNQDWQLAYAKDLRENWISTESAFSRTTFLVVSLATTFVLISGNEVAEFSVGGMKITNLNIVQGALPVVIAYLTFTLSLAAGIAYWLADTHDALYKHYWTDFHSQDLELTLRPSGSFAATEMLAHATDKIWLGRLVALVGVVRFVAYIGGPLVFETYALATLWRSATVPTAEAVVVSALTVVLLIACVPNLAFLGMKLRSDLWDRRIDPDHPEY
jgi:hypothetical protein